MKYAKVLFVVLGVCAVAACDKSRQDKSRGSDMTYRSDSYPSDATKDKTVPETNTDRNVRDRDGGLPTPSDQKMNDADVKRTADIRKRIVDAKLSTDAENVKVVTTDGRVTLRGPVKSQFERDQIVGFAKEIAGDANVDDLLEVETIR